MGKPWAPPEFLRASLFVMLSARAGERRELFQTHVDGVRPNSDGTRTRNPQIRSLIRYPLRHGVFDVAATACFCNTVAAVFRTRPRTVVVAQVPEEEVAEERDVDADEVGDHPTPRDGGNFLGNGQSGGLECSARARGRNGTLRRRERQRAIGSQQDADG